MRISSEEQLLDPNVRAKIIEEIEGPENLNRKKEQYKRYQCYKDKTYLYVIHQLLKQFDRETVNEMMYAIANIAVVRKTIDKLARVYKYGVNRAGEDEAQTEAIQSLEDALDFNQMMKKTNRYFKLHKNTAVYICPMAENLEPDAKKIIKVCPLAPFLYDAIELYQDREEPGCFILSDYSSPEQDGLMYSLNPASANRGVAVQYKVKTSDGIDQVIADSPQDQKNYTTQKDGKTFIFWSNKYHFTCNRKGEIIGSGEIDNPVGRMPFINFAEDQDGAFWAEGGNDLTDGAILVNSMISNINHIAITQGYGQLVMTGKNLPRSQKVGPNKAVLLEHTEDDPTPTFKFETANPPLDQLRALAEMYMALVLTTNNLSTAGISSTLQGGMEFPSGIAMLIDKSESMEDVEDQRQIFIDKEPEIWQLIAKWENILKSRNELSDEYSQMILPDDVEVKIKFNTAVVIQTEKERLETLQLKKDLGLLTKIDILRSEYPDLSDQQLMDKIEEIAKEKQNALIQSFPGQGNFAGNIVNTGAGPAENASGAEEPS